MKTGVNLSKIVSTSIALIVCFAILAFALTALGWGAALPALAAGAVMLITVFDYKFSCIGTSWHADHGRWFWHSGWDCVIVVLGHLLGYSQSSCTSSCFLL